MLYERKAFYMKLYHISVNTETVQRRFAPRIPDLGRNTVNIEDHAVPRVCFSETVDGCMSALPPCSRLLIDCKKAKFVLYEIETDDYPESYFISNEEIVRQNLVYDANLTKEWWLLEPVELQGRLCEIQQIEADTILNFALIEAKEVIQTAREINGSIFYEDIIPKNSDSETCFKAIIHYANQNKIYNICDYLFEELGEKYKEAETWIYRMKFKFLDSKEKATYDER